MRSRNSFQGGLDMKTKRNSQLYRRNRMQLESLELRLPLTSLLGASLDQDLVSSAAPAGGRGGGGGGGHTESYGNNLSYPVIWSDGVTKSLRGDPTAPELLPADCWVEYTLTGVPDVILGRVAEIGLPPEGADNIVYIYPQQNASSWQAGSIIPAEGETTQVDRIDWGDNIESVDWYLRSKVRVETVLLKELMPSTQMVEYQMKHLEGWGIDELWGVVATSPDETASPVAVDHSELGTTPQATIYSGAARLTIQRLYVDRDTITPGKWNDEIQAETPGDLRWNASAGMWTETVADGEDLISETPVFNKVVWEVGDGPEYYSAEINVKGKVIYGTTWDVSAANEGRAITASPLPWMMRTIQMKASEPIWAPRPRS